ncbi:MAG: UbiX family flavin prenyltransferase [Kangiellaceae bacterium]|nr:UbiX family flavin prenyltransferase [Kangiellaceae bacterium]MCW8998045.1 UbiX family flavin prenyltransferase [Kangiellaceae bacterium]MCW9016029.1 UbiX family flavin prenyltransferase [Kangiellaceae bacterium]
MTQDRRISVGVTGASGAIYALNLLKHLSSYYSEIHLMITDAARIVFATEQNLSLPESPAKIAKILCQHLNCDDEIIKVYAKENWYAPVASGSAAPKQMVICPASMGCLSAIATGASNNLLERAADVVIKEKGQLILLPREMPFSTIHLKNMLTLSEAGVTIMPAAPGFYNNPESIDQLADFVSARILNHLGIENSICQAWGYKN